MEKEIILLTNFHSGWISLLDGLYSRHENSSGPKQLKMSIIMKNSIFFILKCLVKILKFENHLNIDE